MLSAYLPSKISKLKKTVESIVLLLMSVISLKWLVN